jgi:lipopolysaccharide export system protein LptA
MTAESGAGAAVTRHRRRAPGRAIMPHAAVLLAALVFGSLSAAAQGLSFGGPSTDNRPIDITADQGIEWQQQAQVYIARGNAVATRGTTAVHADTLTAHYRPSKSKTAEGGNEVYRLDADGHVVIKGPSQTVVGDQAVYDVDRQIAIITGKTLKMTTPTDLVTARDSLEWYDAQQIAVARGDAIASRADKHIRADVLTAHMTKTPGPAAAGPGAAKRGADLLGQNSSPAKPRPAPQKPGGSVDPLGAGGQSSRISRVDAQGHVVVWNATDIGRGDYGVYNADTGIVTLLGNVTITRGQDVVRGQYAVVDLNTNISRIMTVAAKPGAPAHRVEGLLVRQDAAAAPGSRAAAAKSAAAKTAVSKSAASKSAAAQGRLPP